MIHQNLVFASGNAKMPHTIKGTKQGEPVAPPSLSVVDW